MVDVVLPNSPIRTSRLGFGCAYLTGGFDAKASRKLVEIAYDVGYRHFDVAPLYGIGTAERILGEVLKGRRSEVTIATKVGISRPVLTTRMQMLRLVSKPLRAFLPSFTRKYSRKVVSSNVVTKNFSTAFLEESLADTLRYLRTDYLDVLLLHDVSKMDLTDNVLTFLERKQEAGVVRTFGVASSATEVAEICSTFEGKFKVLQYPWSVFDGSSALLGDDVFNITHRAILDAYRVFLEIVRKNPRVLGVFSEAIGHDLADRQVMIKVLLGASIFRNPHGITLVGSRHPERIRKNAELIDHEGFVDAGGKFLGLLVGHPGAMIFNEG